MGSGKIDLQLAEKLANDVLQLISPAMQRAEIAGSVRRRKHVVGDIEIVGIQADQEKLVKFLQEVGQTIKPGVPGIIPWTPKPNARYIRVRLDAGINLDLFMGRTDNFGGLFLMRTGSGAGPSGKPFDGFTPGCFSRFKKLSGGGRMTEAMPTMPTGEQLAVPEEQDFFDILEMNFVPPEERISKSIIKQYARNKETK